MQMHHLGIHCCHCFDVYWSWCVPQWWCYDNPTWWQWSNFCIVKETPQQSSLSISCTWSHALYISNLLHLINRLLMTSGRDQDHYRLPWFKAKQIIIKDFWEVFPCKQMKPWKRQNTNIILNLKFLKKIGHACLLCCVWSAMFLLTFLCFL